MKILKSIFRAYDIRGVVGEGLSNRSIYAIGLELAEVFREKKVNICGLGRDMRVSSFVFSRVLRSALENKGIIVEDFGEVPTPVLYYGSFCLEKKTGVMITGSHNPPEYNGLKIMINGLPFWGQELQLLYKRIISNDCQYKEVDTKEYQKNSFKADSYKKTVLKKHKLASKCDKP